MSKAKTGRTHYSDRIKGDRANYNWDARFDITDGYLGITQFDGEKVCDRVLLSPNQMRLLFDFVRNLNTKRAA